MAAMHETRRALCSAIIPLFLLQLVLPTAALGQAVSPLQKSDLVRMLTGSQFSRAEIADVLKQRCVAFSPTERDREDLRALRAGGEVLESLDSCLRARAQRETRAAREAEQRARIEIPPPPSAGPIDVDPLTEPTESLRDLAAGEELLRGSGPGAAARTAARTAAPASAGPDERPTPPRLENRHDFSRALLEHYPADARRRGVRGEVLLRLYVDETGEVTRTEVARSSGHQVLDDAALWAALEMDFEPARLGERPVGMWIEIPVILSP